MPKSILHARQEGRPTVDNSEAYGFLRGLSWIKIWLLRPLSIALFQRKLKVYKKSIRKQTRSLLEVVAHPSVVASKIQDGKFYNGAGISHWIFSCHHLSQAFTLCSSHPTYETTPTSNPSQTLYNIYLIHLIYINLLDFFLTWKGFGADMLDHVVITPVSKTGFGSVQIPCMSTQDPTFERYSG